MLQLTGTPKDVLIVALWIFAFVVPIGLTRWGIQAFRKRREVGSYEGIGEVSERSFVPAKEDYILNLETNIDGTISSSFSEPIKVFVPQQYLFKVWIRDIGQYAEVKIDKGIYDNFKRGAQVKVKYEMFVWNQTLKNATLV